ncbi:hypothetical protein D7V20_04155 [Acinetobacter rongchengensis]|uniref:Uncharacterized protein n=2 Tax=Acinetobacter rongchengensis TaxID=2419601 RepID=A0A3A8FGD3_9GAMM|nr:hypothetical protein D7V20_04155 [Acinetobacter rongchengensis]
MYLNLNKVGFCRILSMSICLVLVACDSQNPIDQEQSEDAQNSLSKVEQDQSAQQTNAAKKLTEVAGQATLPAPAASELKDLDVEPIPAKAESFVGRYHTQMSCTDRFANCKTGNAEFIVNLLADGTAHRNIVYMGKMTYENNEIKQNRSYQKNTWVYDEVNHEIIINRVEGIQFFYKVDADRNLVMDLDKILNSSESNKLYFNQNNPAPAKAYVLKKMNN